LKLPESLKVAGPIFALYLLPTIAAASFALVSYPELMKLLLSKVGFNPDAGDGLAIDVRTLAVTVGLGSMIGSIFYARKEAGSLRAVNTILRERETELQLSTKSLERREIEWSAFKNSAFEGLKRVLDSYIRNYAIDYYKNSHSGANPPNTLRISIYTHDKDSNVCYLVGRYSYNTLYNGSGRSEYPIDTGAIGQAWDKGSADIQISKSWHDDVIKNINMKSQAFLSKRISGGTDANTPKTGLAASAMKPIT